MIRKNITLAIILLLGLSMTPVAWAHRPGPGWRGNVRIRIVPPPMGPRYFPPPYYFAPYFSYPPPRPVYVAPSPPPVYMEQAPAEPPPESYWYYCTEPEGYYPYLEECPGGWLKVLPQAQPEH